MFDQTTKPNVCVFMANTKLQILNSEFEEAIGTRLQ